MTSTRGCSQVPRTRTLIGGAPWRTALVTSSETPNSAHSTRSGRLMSWQVSITQRRACCTPLGPEPNVRAGRFSGTVFSPSGRTSKSQSRLAYPLCPAGKPPAPILTASGLANNGTRRVRGRDDDGIRTARSCTWDRLAVRAGTPAEWGHGSHAGSREPAPRRRGRVGLRGALRNEGAQEARRRRDDGRQDHPPPLPAAALPGRDRHPLAGRDRPADARGAQQPEERQGPPGRGHRDRPREAGGHLPGARPADRDAVRLPDRGGRRRPVLLRQRPLRRARAGHEVDRRRAGAARPDLRRLRDGRARRHPRRAGRPPAHVRRGGRRADRRRDGGPDRRARAPHPAPRLPGDQHPHRTGDPARRRAPGAAAVRAEARRQGQGRAGEAGRRGDPRGDGHRRRRARHRDEVQGRPHRADRHRHQDLGRRASRPTRSAAPCRSRPARRSTGPAGSPSTPT